MQSRTLIRSKFGGRLHISTPGIEAFKLLASFLSILFIPLFSDASSVNNDVAEEFLHQFVNGPRDQRIKVMRWLEYSGIQEAKVYDLAEEKLLLGYPKALNANVGASEELAWICRGLAASGNSRYLPAIKTVKNRSKSTKVRNACQAAIDRFSHFNRWNQAFEDVPYWSSMAGRQRAKAYQKILDFGDPQLEKVVYQKLFDYSGMTDKDLLDAISEKIMSKANKKTLSRSEQDIIAWQLKALAASGLDTYKQKVSEVVERATKRSKVERHGKRAIKLFSEFKEWNESVSRASRVAIAESDQQSVWLYLMQTGNVKQASYSVRHAYEFEQVDEALTAIVVSRVAKMLSAPTNDKDALEFQSWACKYLVLAGSESGLELVRRATKESPNPKVRYYANKALKSTY